MTFNNYLQRKQAPKNSWRYIPEDHFLCTPSLVAQAWKLNILIIWKKHGLFKVFALPYGRQESPVIPILYSANGTVTDKDGNPTLIDSKVNRFYPLSVTSDKQHTWESALLLDPQIPESALATEVQIPIVIPKFVPKRDREFAFQSSVMVDGPGKNGKEISSDESSERTVDGMDEATQAALDKFINDDDIESSGPPGFNPVLEQLDRELNARQFNEANLSLLQLNRRRRIITSDEEDDDVPIITVQLPSLPTTSKEKPKTTKQSKSVSKGTTTKLVPEAATKPKLPGRKQNDA
jgi:hypothetical protein